MFLSTGNCLWAVCDATELHVGKIAAYTSITLSGQSRSEAPGGNFAVVLGIDVSFLWAS